MADEPLTTVSQQDHGRMTELEPPQDGDFIVTVSQIINGKPVPVWVCKVGDGEGDRLDLHKGHPSHIDLHISQVRHV